jgi:hypothetical protein
VRQLRQGVGRGRSDNQQVGLMGQANMLHMPFAAPQVGIHIGAPPVDWKVKA